MWPVPLPYLHTSQEEKRRIFNIFNGPTDFRKPQEDTNYKVYVFFYRNVKLEKSSDFYHHTYYILVRYLLNRQSSWTEQNIS